MHAATSYSSGIAMWHWNNPIHCIWVSGVFFYCLCVHVICSMLCHLLNIIAIKTILTNWKSISNCIPVFRLCCTEAGAQRICAESIDQRRRRHTSGLDKFPYTDMPLVSCCLQHAPQQTIHNMRAREREVEIHTIHTLNLTLYSIVYGLTQPKPGCACAKKHKNLRLLTLTENWLGWAELLLVSTYLSRTERLVENKFG